MPLKVQFPSALQIRALELGADELMGRLEWILRDRPRALCNARMRYQCFCASLMSQIENIAPGRPGAFKETV